MSRCNGLSPCARVRQRGAALIVTLLMLIAVLMLGMSAAHLALQNEKASRNDRDRRIAQQAAEAALRDAELDIENSPDASRSRSAMFSKDSARGFPAESERACGTGEDNMALGLCEHRPEGLAPAWAQVDFDETAPGRTQSVPFGKFTGQRFQIGVGYQPCRLPRYVIELMMYNRQGESADRPGYFYRITAIGYGARSTTQVVLQSMYRKEG
jgi:type IV pilus assembly protein PilX